MGGDIADIEKQLAAADKQPEFTTALRLLEATAERHDLLRKPSLRRSRSVTKKEYRRFTLDANWFVLVGRSNRENDEITFKVAAPTDIWMHAQQVAGSHVVLKSSGATGNPPRKILEAAAAIAAHYSKAKHAGVVPVIYTRRKYVRKFRGAKPGQVTCEREQTVFVEPGLPVEK